jgi:hypothetical protein
MDTVDSLLAQFPGPLKLGPSKRYWLGGLLGSALLMAGAATGITSGHTIVAWAVLIFFGLCAANCISVLLFGLSELTLDQDGFTTRLGRTANHWKWTEVSDFAVVPHELVPFMKCVGFNYNKAQWGPLLKILERSNQPFQWRTRSLSDTYSLSKGDCVRLLSQWQQRALPTS